MPTTLERTYFEPYFYKVRNTFRHYFTREATTKNVRCSVARGHDSGDRVHVDLFRDLLGLDLLVLTRDEDVARRLRRLLPTVLLDPLESDSTSKFELTIKP